MWVHFQGAGDGGKAKSVFDSKYAHNPYRDTVIAESCCGIGLINSVVQFDVRAVFICQSQNILLRSALQAAVSITRKTYVLSTKIW